RCPGDAAVDTVTIPEALLHLQADFQEMTSLHGRERLGIIFGEVVVDAGHKVMRNAVEAPVAAHFLTFALVIVDNVDAVRRQVYRLYLRVGIDGAANIPGE